MTDYKKWENFDEAAVEHEIESQQSLCDAKEAKKKVFVTNARENEQAIRSAKNNAAVLESKVINPNF